MFKIWQFYVINLTKACKLNTLVTVADIAKSLQFSWHMAPIDIAYIMSVKNEIHLAENLGNLYL